jgi:tetratricopeptide (TPR) repeat protein
MRLFRKPQTWQEHFEEGMASGAASDFSRAEVSFREAVRLAPDEPYPRYELGYTLTLLGRHEEALEEFRRTEQLSRGFFLVETEIFLCEQLLSGSIGVDVLEMLRWLQRLTDDGEWQSEEAVVWSRKVIELAPECALGHFISARRCSNASPRLRRRPFSAASSCSRTIRRRSTRSGTSAPCGSRLDRRTRLAVSGTR